MCIGELSAVLALLMSKLDWKNDDAREMYNTNGWIKFKSSMIKSFFVILVICIHTRKWNYGTITITGEEDNDTAKQLDERNTVVLFKNCIIFIDWISRINNTQIDIAKDLDIVMPIYNLFECSANYSISLWSLW